MSDWISRDAVFDILDEEGWYGYTKKRIGALPAVQPDAARILDLLRAALGNGMTMQQLNEARALLNAPTGKEVMPSDAGTARPSHDEAPAGNMTAGGGAEPTAVQPMTVRLVFNNADAMPKTTVLDVSAEAVPDIMAWYGAYCSGDRYTVTVDGRNVPMDQNGEPAHVNETPKSEHDAGNMLTPATKGDWQPIETAPKRRVIDLWSVEGERYPDAIWGVCGDTEGWTDANDHGSLEGFTFTNWRDRPAPPRPPRKGVTHD